MQNLIQWIERQSRTVAAAVGLIGSDVVGSINQSKARGLNPRTRMKAIGFVFIAVVGLVNLNTIRGLNLEFIYLLGCAFVGWAAGARAAMFCTLISGVFLYFAEAHGGTLPGWIVLLNSVVRLAAFAVIGWLAAEVGTLTRDLERKVQQRTARLQSEVREHKETSELLQETMQLFKQVTENITDVFWVTDPAKTKFHYVSPEFEKVWGESRKSLYVSPSTWLEGIHAEDRERVTGATFTKQVTGEYDEEYRVVRPDGSLRWVHDRAFPVKDRDGTVYRLVGVTEDITERKRTDQLLRAERDVGIALSYTSDLSYALDRLLDIAVQFEGIDCGGVYLMDLQTGELHLEAHRGLSRSFIKRISQYKADATETRMAKSGEIVYVRHEQIPRSLEVLWGSEGLRALAVVPVQHKGAVLGMLNLGSYRQEEILPKTRLGIEMIASQFAGAIARIRAEEGLRRSEAHLRTIVHNAPIALLAGDKNGLITFEDGQALKALGTKAGEHVGHAVAEVYRDFPAIAESVNRTLAGEEFSSVLALGSTVLECHCAPSRDESGSIAGFLSVATNVTERIRLERQILEISDREQGRIGQDIHDGLCQQLVSIAFDANSMEKSLASQSLAESRFVRRIATLLDEAISEARRVSRGLYPVRLESEGLVSALKDLANSTNERFNLRCVCKADLPDLICDVTTATHLYRIAQEAVNNAVKHSAARSVAIHLAESDGQIELAIQDDGRGIGQPPRRTSGMGLHIMDYRARSIGGALRVQPMDGGGTVVICRVPRKAL
jgi:PAS domain S-box-containing protein